MNDLMARMGSGALRSVADQMAGTTIQILRELLQNASRAGATEIRIDCMPYSIRVADNGHGILDPEALLTYGASCWRPHVLGDAPRGVGFYALADREVQVTTRLKPDAGTDTPLSWSVDLTPARFRGEAVAIRKAADSPTKNGTRVSFSDQYGMKGWALEQECRYLDSTVYVNGDQVEREPFISGESERLTWNGMEIGLFDDHEGVEQRSEISIRGLVSPLRVRACPGYGHARVRVLDGSRLRPERPGLTVDSSHPFIARLEGTIERALEERRRGGDGASVLGP